MGFKIFEDVVVTIDSYYKCCESYHVFFRFTVHVFVMLSLCYLLSKARWCFASCFVSKNLVNPAEASTRGGRDFVVRHALLFL